MDLTTMTDEQLEQLRADVGAEQERRYRLTIIPDQIEALRVQYAADGGNPAEL